MTEYELEETMTTITPREGRNQFSWTTRRNQKGRPDRLLILYLSSREAQRGEKNVAIMAIESPAANTDAFLLSESP